LEQYRWENNMFVGIDVSKIRLAAAGEHGGRLVKHCTLLLAKSHLRRRLFGGILLRIATLPTPGG